MDHRQQTTYKTQKPLQGTPNHNSKLQTINSFHSPLHLAIPDLAR